MEWVRRNRHRLAVGGGLLGGLYLVSRVAGRQVALAREEEARRALDRGKKSQHFTTTEATGAATLASLLPTLRAEVDSSLDTAALTSLLRERPDPARKAELWAQLKVTALGRCLAVVVGGAVLAVTLRLQLHLLAGQLYHQETAASEPRMSAALQQAFLHISHHFVTAGTRSMCRRLEEVVTARTAGLPLHRRLTLADLESVIMDLFQGCREQGGGLFTDPGVFLLGGEQWEDQELSGPERARLRGLLADCLDLLESEDTQAVTLQLCRPGWMRASATCGWSTSRPARRSAPWRRMCTRPSATRPRWRRRAGAPCSTALCPAGTGGQSEPKFMLCHLSKA